MYNISFNASVEYVILNFTFFLFRPHSFSLVHNAWHWNKTLVPLFFLRRVPVAALHVRSVLCNISHLTEDDGEVYMYTRVVELHNALKNKTNNIQIDKSFKTLINKVNVIAIIAHLWNQIFLNPLQLGLLPAIFCHHRLFIEFMGEIAVFVIVQRTTNTTKKYNIVKLCDKRGIISDWILKGSFHPKHTNTTVFS